MGRGEQLAGHVVQLPTDPSRLLFSPLVEVPQRLVGLPGAPIRHLEGRQALEHEPLGALDRPVAVRVATRIERHPQHEQRHVQDSDTLGHRESAKLVRLVKRVLPSPFEVTAERAGAALFESRS